jgi:hypothetical protein
MDWRAGDVLRVWDHLTHPPKTKRHICVSPEEQLFLRINSEPAFPPHALLRADQSSFLEHDSYVELQQLHRLLAYHIEGAELLGRLSETQKRLIVIAIEQQETLAPDTVDLVRRNFGI